MKNMILIGTTVNFGNCMDTRKLLEIIGNLDKNQMKEWITAVECK